MSPGQRRRSPRRRALALLGSLLVATPHPACDREEAPAETAQRSHTPEIEPPLEPELEVTLVGCQALIDGACVFVPDSEEELRLWAPVHPDRPLTALLDGVELTDSARPTAVDSGQRLVLSALPAEAHRLDLETAGFAPWTITLRAASPPTAAIAAAKATHERADEAFLAGEHRRALADYAAAMEQHLDLDMHRAANDIALTATYLCAEVLLDLGCAQRWLDRHRRLFDVFPEARLRHTFYRGNVEERRGELHRALADYREHAEFALRLGLDRDATAALSAVAVLSGQLGDFAGSAAALKRATLLTGGRNTDDYGRLLNNTAWTWVLARDQGLPTEDPRPLLREALTHFVGDEAVQREAQVAAHFRINLAFAELLAGDTAAAAELLRELEKVPLETRQRLWRDYIAARLAAAEGDHELALRRYTALAAATAESQRGALRIRALVGRGEALAALDRREEAVDALLLAERALDSLLAEFALDGSRERYAALNDRSSRRAVSLLVSLGRPRQALCVARLARRRTYEALSQLIQHRSRDAADGQRRALARYQATRAEIELETSRSYSLPRRDGELLRAEQRRRAAANLRELDVALAVPELAPVASTTCEELAQPAEGELLLALLPGAEGWLGFATLGAQTETAELLLPAPGAPPGEWSEALLRPFAGLLSDARRVRVITDGEILQVPIHGLPFAGAPLFERLPVAYSLDLAERGSAQPQRSQQALTIAPPSNLLHAEAEAAGVAARLEERGWIVESLTGELATGAELRARLGEVDLLHFVGHANAERTSRWDDALELAAGTSVTIPDLLALAAPTPQVVVLNGCRTGLADPRAAAGGMSLAHALLVAGSEAVVATTDDIDDADALALTKVFYDALARAPEVDVAAALAAALTADDGCSGPSCLHYRAWIR